MRRALIRLTAGLARVDVRLRWLERVLRLELSPRDVAAIRASAAPGFRLGAFYHWYLQKALIAGLARRAAPARVIDLLARMDRTEYAPPLAQWGQSRGVLVCIPHHGHYVLSMLGLAARLKDRDVLVFYNHPSRNAGNAVFDSLHGRLRDVVPHVRVVHDTRKGLADVVRGLRRGAVVLLMPDAVSAAPSPFHVPFGGRALPVMHGPAQLARLTGALVVPTVSRVGSHGTFRTEFAPPMVHATDTGDALETTWLDHRFVASMFRALEHLMRDEFPYWQHVRSHFGQAPLLPSEPASHPALRRAFLRDPQLRFALRPPICLD